MFKSNMTTLSSHKSLTTKTAAAEPARPSLRSEATALARSEAEDVVRSELSTEVPSVDTGTKKPESQPQPEPARTTSSPSLRSNTVSVPVTPVKPVTPTPAPKKVKVTQAPYFVSVDGCLHPLS